MNYSKLYDKLIALSRDTSTTPGERKAAAAKAYHIHKKHLANPHSSEAKEFKSDFRTPQGGNPFAYGPDTVTFQYASYANIFQDNHQLKEQFKKALRGVIKERDKLKQKGEL